MADFLATPLGTFLLIVVQGLGIIAFVMLSLLFLVYGDRKIWAAVQMRKGPNVVGAFGLLQSVADALKYVVKEIVVPAGADKFVFFLAPMLSFVLAILAWAVIPFHPGWVLADINVAILFVFAVSSLEVYGVIMGGWASNSKYPFLGSLAVGRADDLLRGLARPDHHRGDHLDRQHELLRHRRGAGGGLGPLQLVLAAASADGGAVLHLGSGRDQPPALRPAGSGIGTRRRASWSNIPRPPTFFSWPANTSRSS